MEVKLDPKYAFVKENGKFDQRSALIVAGVKAAVCFKDGKITPEEIRANETDEQLIKRGLDTILNDHGTPTEHPVVGLEIVGIPKIVVMMLNNEHQYTTCERSLRYTEVKDNPYISDLENELYEKWLNIFQNVLSTKYGAFFTQFFPDEKKRKSAIKKLAQENARYLITVFMPTTLTYTVPLAQINKVTLYMDKLINDSNNTELEKLTIPYLKDLISQLRDLNVLILNSDAKKLCPDFPVEDNNQPVYRNNKEINLSLFAEKNKFSGIYLPNEFGVGFSYNFYPSFASLAQFHRHRTIDFEMLVEDDKYQFYIPPMIQDDPELVAEWNRDMFSVQNYYPQGQLVRTNATGSLKNLLSYVGKERACDRAQLETQDTFTNQIIPDYYDGLIKEGKDGLAELVKPYVKKLRCQYADYHCPSKCGHPRNRRYF